MSASSLRQFKKAAYASTFYVVITGIVLLILIPIYFLTALSFMSDSEAYNRWPLPLAPSLSEEFSLQKDGPDAALRLKDRRTGKYSALLTENDLEELAAFARRKTNCAVTEALLREKLDESARKNTTALFRVRKRLFSNYVSFFRVASRDAWPALVRSLQVALVTILISVGIGGMAGFAFARHIFKGRNLLRVSVLFVRIFPGIAVAIPMVIILANLGLYDNPVGLALVYAVGQIALSVWITASIFAAIPVSLEEAALVFGATRFQAFTRITLPLALPGLVACAMYAFIGSWNETIQALVLTQANPTFPVVVYQTLVGSKGMVNLTAAGSVVMALPAVLFTLIIRKYILNMWGGVKV